MCTSRDLSLLKEKGIGKEQIGHQLGYFRNGFPSLKVVSAASAGRGIMKIGVEDEKRYIKAWRDFLQSDRKITKFVPASGAASRMFKDLYAFMDSDYSEPSTSFEKTFFNKIHLFAFFGPLDDTCRDLYGKSVDNLMREGRYKDVVSALLSPDGLNYGYLPKGLLLFHRYPEGNRTPVGEHLTEGTYYAKNRKGEVEVHFTVSPEHQEMFELLVAARKLSYEFKLGATFNVSFSAQKPSTDTIAVDMTNEPFRNEDGSLLFRPGGHGALIENLNDIDSDIIFIKNIDNVVPDQRKENEAYYKRLLAGVLVTMQKRTHDYLDLLESGKATDNDLSEMLAFTENELCISHPGRLSSQEELITYLKQKLDRPFRVCGMVKNEGEPGGGPFIVVNPDGTASPQILESTQIDKNDPVAMEAFSRSTHFNPVDVVCGVKCNKGNKYNLTDFVDRNTGFISYKSKNGKELKALELPGLWNGAMSDWNTVFVEVPISTFNPVKTVNDLLRPEHQQG